MKLHDYVSLTPRLLWLKLLRLHIEWSHNVRNEQFSFRRKSRNIQSKLNAIDAHSLRFTNKERSGLRFDDTIACVRLRFERSRTHTGRVTITVGCSRWKVFGGQHHGGMPWETYTHCLYSHRCRIVLLFMPSVDHCSLMSLLVGESAYLTRLNVLHFRTKNSNTQNWTLVLDERVVCWRYSFTFSSP